MRHPGIGLAVFRIRAVMAVMAVMAVNAGFLFTLTLHIQGGLGCSPILTRALTTVRPEGAVDASGLLAAVTQLGRLIGVVAFGTLFLNRLESLGFPGAYTSADALLACMCALAGTAFLGAVSGLVRRRR